MADKKKYTLCGGTFLVLLLQARKPRFASRKNTEGKTDGLSDNELFESLLHVSFPEHVANKRGGSPRTFTSMYKSCKLATNDYLPFKDEKRIDIFDDEVQHNYSTVLQRMCRFTSDFLNADNLGSWLVRAILETIKYDDSITDEKFYINADGTAVDKEHMLAADEFDLQPFLLGIWHFILKNRPNNLAGRETFEAWHEKPQIGRAVWQFNSDIGKKWKDIAVNVIPWRNTGENNSDDGATIHPSVPTVPAVPVIDLHLYRQYLQKTYEKYSEMKTLLYTDAPRRFYDFYVCNDIVKKGNTARNIFYPEVISNATVEDLIKRSRFIVITGTGGIGKSMMMHHLLLNSIECFKKNKNAKLPVFIELRDYSDKYDGLLDYIFIQFKMLSGLDSLDDLIDLLSKGLCILLLDGMDEIKSDYRDKFERDLDAFTDKYSDNIFIVSSRPTDSFISLKRFTVFYICPFDKDQALLLIDKLDLDDSKVKEKFRKELVDNLFETHEEFTKNPLLLTIMLMTYKQYAEIPSKMHIFYKEAYETLAQKHDASKGAYKRAFKTGLTANRFADYFSEFCARSYRDEKFEFTDTEFDDYFNKLKEREKDNCTVESTDFKEDLIENVCLMFFESGKYHFVHRSFQEYFCALFFSKQKDRTLGAIGEFFESKHVRYRADKTFDMLYDMIPEKVEEYIFLPYLQKLFDECDNDIAFDYFDYEKDNSYYNFLIELYPHLYFYTGETGDISENKANSFLYNAIIDIKHLAVPLSSDELSCEEQFITDEWVLLDENYSNPNYDTDNLYEVNEVPSDYEEKFGKPEIVGQNYEIDVYDLLDREDENWSAIEDLSGNYFSLKEEYQKVRKYFEKLKSKFENHGDDLFDLFD